MIPGLFYYDKIFYYNKKGENRKMNTSGEAAEQVMRMSLEGAEILIKLTGSGRCGKESRVECNQSPRISRSPEPL